MKEIIKCQFCGKDITEDVKYKQMGDQGWKCRKCYFKREVTETSNLGNSKIVMDYGEEEKLQC